MSRLETGQIATLACLLEIAAPKPGNVHRGADFADMTFGDLAASAVAIAPALQIAKDQSLGQTVLGAARATQALVGKNTNLGIILLLAPLAKARLPGGEDVTNLREATRQVLRALSPADCGHVYEAIRLARPGGLGRVAVGDIHDLPPQDLIQAMRLAANHDAVALQYANDFATIFEQVVPWLQATQEAGWTLPMAIVHVQMQLMAELPDTLIARKCGQTVARQAAGLAAEVMASGDPRGEEYSRRLANLDFWLRSDGHRRNPGTTADLIAAGLFVGLSAGMIKERW